MGDDVHLENTQLRQLTTSRLKRKLQQAMLRHAPGFDELDADQQSEFADDALRESRAWGFLTEQGCAAYALAMWFLEPDFPEGSQYVRALLESRAPEVRKVHAMNEWVAARLAAPDDPRAADEKMRQAYYSTHAFGRQA